MEEEKNDAISKLQTGQGNVDIKVSVKSIEETRSFNKFGRDLKVANAVVTDGTGEIKLTLWNKDIDKVKVGSIIKITNGYVNEFQGEKQLTSGKFGKLEFVGESETSEESEEELEGSSEEKTNKEGEESNKEVEDY